MRADATHRLLLNSPLFKEFFIEVSNEKYVRFTIIEGSEPISYMARVRSFLFLVTRRRGETSLRRGIDLTLRIGPLRQLGNPAAAEALVAAIRERTSAL